MLYSRKQPVEMARMLPRDRRTASWMTQGTHWLDTSMNPQRSLGKTRGISLMISA